MGTDEDQTTAFPPHKVVGNIYYVGTRTLSSYLITTPEGHILINTTYERNVRTIEKSVTALGFKFVDIRIVLGTHAHGDHQEGDALTKELTGAQVFVMREDVPRSKRSNRAGRHIRSTERCTRGQVSLGNARRPQNRRPYARLYHMDHEGVGGRQELQRGVRVQLSRTGRRDARDRERVQSNVQDRARVAL
jgi:glyoxylase-like metal-dependent hydrolase (beta-lactamase superfamily II)